LYLKINEKKL